jgi:hypothetical protein
MEKELKIKVHIDSNFEIESNADLKDWNEASNESRNIYVKDQVKEYLLDHIDQIIDDLMDGSEIKF